MRSSGDAPITTIAVAGFPMDASVRELKNLCFLCDGFEQSKPNIRPDKPPIVFVKFTSVEAASQAIARLQTMTFDEDAEASKTLKAEFARSDLLPSQSAQWAAPQPYSEGWHQHPSKRIRTSPPPAPPGWLAARTNSSMWVQPRWEEHHPQPVNGASWKGAGEWAHHAPQQASYADDEMASKDTLACKVEGSTPQDIVEFFDQLPGFEVLKFNSTGRNCFAKFAHAQQAMDALHIGRDAGLVLDFAKRSLELADVRSAAAAPGWEAPPAPPPALEGGCGHPIDTLACRIEANGPDDINAFFEQLDGFVGFKTNNSGRNAFLRFLSHEHALEALNAGREAGYAVEFARRSMAEQDNEREYPTTVPDSLTPTSGCDTLACKLDGHTDRDIQQFFEQFEGFMNVKMNSSGVNCFVRFINPSMAEAALGAGQEAGFTVDFAKRGSSGVAGPPAAGKGYDSHQGPAAGGVRTLACRLGGQQDSEIKGFFEHLQGFEDITFNGKVNCFVKFDSTQSADDAMQLATNAGFRVQFAKS